MTADRLRALRSRPTRSRPMRPLPVIVAAILLAGCALLVGCDDGDPPDATSDAADPADLAPPPADVVVIDLPEPEPPSPDAPDWSALVPEPTPPLKHALAFNLAYNHPPDPGVPLSDCFDPNFLDAPAAPDYGSVDGRLAHCAGTHHTTIDAAGAIALIGDALWGRLGPNPDAPTLRDDLATALTARFGALNVQVCTHPDAAIADLSGPDGLIARCRLPIPPAEPNLYIVAIGTNDLRALAAEIAARPIGTPIAAAVDQRVQSFDRVIATLRAADPTAHIVLANATDWTDGTGDPRNCHGWPPLDAPRHRRFAEAAALLATGYMQTAVTHRAELVLIYENTCGHGAYAGTGQGRCADDGIRWVDEACRYPTARHLTHLAGLFLAVIDP